jgi:flagellar biosynthesis protein FlhB
VAEQDLDKSDPASPYKLEKAREQGSVAKSPEVTYVVILFGMTCLVFAMGDQLIKDLARICHALLGQMNRHMWEPVAVMQLVKSVTTEVVLVLAPPLLLLALLAIGISVWQVGFTLSAEPLKPDFNRINPASGFKKIFSIRTVYELVRNCIKLSLVALLLWIIGGNALGALARLSYRDVNAIVEYTRHQTGTLLAMLTALFALLAMVDFVFSKWEFLKQMRMSKREIKDEHKQREGDPRIKSRIKELRLEWFKKGMSLQKVKDADVLVTNPTHYAVAIAYKRETMAAPYVLCVGAGDLAQRMRHLASKHHVPVVQNPKLARALYSQAQPDAPLPEQHYAEVAKILVWVFAMRKQPTVWPVPR